MVNFVAKLIPENSGEGDFNVDVDKHPGSLEPAQEESRQAAQLHSQATWRELLAYL